MSTVFACVRGRNFEIFEFRDAHLHMAERINLRTRSSRRGLVQSKTLHIVKLAKGVALGYRKGLKGGSWIARRHDGGTRYTFQPLGIADDHSSADGHKVLTFDQAQDSARSWFKQRALENAGEVTTGQYTVAPAMEDYASKRESVKRKSLLATRSAIWEHILPDLGDIQLSKLMRSRIESWHEALANAAPRPYTRRQAVSLP